MLLLGAGECPLVELAVCGVVNYEVHLLAHDDWVLACVECSVDRLLGKYVHRELVGCLVALAVLNGYCDLLLTGVLECHCRLDDAEVAYACVLDVPVELLCSVAVCR